MKQLCKCRLKDYMTERLIAARKQQNLTQAKFSEKLMMDTRSYVSMENGESFCCTLTFIIYLCFYCNDTEDLISNLRKIILKAQNNEKTVS